MKIRRLSLTSMIVTLFSLVVALAWIFPLYWAVNTSLSVDTKTVQVPPSWFPVPMILDSYEYVIKNTSIIRWYFNSVLTSVVITAAVLLLTVMCAYALSQIKFRGNRFLFLAILAGFMIPGQRTWSPSSCS